MLEPRKSLESRVSASKVQGEDDDGDDEDELDFFCFSWMPLIDALKETRVLKEHRETSRILVNRWYNTLLKLNHGLPRVSF